MQLTAELNDVLTGCWESHRVKSRQEVLQEFIHSHHACRCSIYLLPKEQGYWGINVTQANTWVDKKLHFQHLMSIINAPQVGGVLRNRLRKATKIWMCCRFSIRDMQQARIHDDETPDYAIRTNFPHLRRLLLSQGDIKSWLIQLYKTWNHPYDSTVETALTKKFDGCCYYVSWETPKCSQLNSQPIGALRSIEAVLTYKELTLWWMGLVLQRSLVGGEAIY